jgi:hypothetical protein
MSNPRSVLQSFSIDTATLAPLTEENTDGIYTVAVPAKEVLSVWRRLRDAAPQTGYWPVLLGGSDDLGIHQEQIEDDERTPADIIQQGLSIDPLAWLTSRKLEWFAEDEDASLDVYHGEWSQGTHAKHTFSVSRDFTGFLKPLLYLGMVPAACSWEVPAHLKLGGWNDCPFSEVHVSLMKYWAGKYGAEIVCATHDVVEMQVSRPPTTREAALELASEQFFYCEDVVAQGTETLERLAVTLLNGTVWFFWWD